MSTIKFWRLMIRFSLLLGLAGLLVLALQPDLPARAEVAARPVLQDDYPGVPTFDPGPGYVPPPTDEPDEGYPADTPGASPSTTPTATATAPSSGTRPPVGSPTALVETPTPNLSQTAELDPFRTEDAEMGSSQNGTPTTPMPGETPTPTVSPTPGPEGMNRMTAGDADSDGFAMNWGLFWIGFSIPVVGACGAVLYLLDRRPELFRPKRR